MSGDPQALLPAHVVKTADEMSGALLDRKVGAIPFRFKIRVGDSRFP